MPQCQLHVFFCFWFHKGRKTIFSELDGTKAKVNILPWGTRSPEERRRGDPGPPHPPGTGGTTPLLGRVWAPWPPPSLASSPIRSPRCLNPKYLINIPRNRLYPPPPSSLDGGGIRSSSRHLLEGRSSRSPSSSLCQPPV